MLPFCSPLFHISLNCNESRFTQPALFVQRLFAFEKTLHKGRQLFIIILYRSSRLLRILLRAGLRLRRGLLILHLPRLFILLLDRRLLILRSLRLNGLLISGLRILLLCLLLLIRCWTNW